MPKRQNIFIERLAEAHNIIPESGDDAAVEPLFLPLASIDPNPQQARQVFDKLEELAASIAENGVLQPIGVRKRDERYIIIYGERRYRAAKKAGLTEIPATIHDVDEGQAAVMTALENLQREDLDIEDEARYFQSLLDNIPGLSQRKLARQLGIDHVYISRRVKLLNNPKLMEQYRSGQTRLLTALETLTDESQERNELEGDSESVSPRNTAFRWRPVQRSYTTLLRLKPESIPAGERETFKHMLDEMQAEIERLRKGLE